MKYRWLITYLREDGPPTSASVIATNAFDALDKFGRAVKVYTEIISLERKETLL